MSVAPLDTFIPTLEQCQIEIEKIHAMLDNHLEVAPDDVNWAHAGTAGRLLKDLREITTYLLVPVEKRETLLPEYKCPQCERSLELIDAELSGPGQHMFYCHSCSGSYTSQWLKQHRVDQDKQQ